MLAITRRDFILRRERFGGTLFHKPTSRLMFLNDDGREFCEALLSPDKDEAVMRLAGRFDCPVPEIERLCDELYRQIAQHIADAGHYDVAAPPFPSILELPPEERCLCAPVFFSWEVTSRCNFGCAYCATNSHFRCSHPEEFTEQEAFGVAAELVRHQVCQVFLSGGEPFLFAPLGLIVQYLVSQGISVIVATNGTRVKEQDLELLRGATLQVKCDTVDPLRYEHITGVSGSFAEFVDGAEKLKRSGLTYYFQAAVSRHDIYGLEDMVRFGVAHNATKYKMTPVIPVARGRSVDWRFDRAEARHLARELDRLSEKYGAFVDHKSVAVGLQSIALNDPSEHPITNCKATRCYMRLTYSKQWVPCNCVRDISVGAFRPGSFIETWRGPSMRSLRANSFTCPVRVERVID